MATSDRVIIDRLRRTFCKCHFLRAVAAIEARTKKQIPPTTPTNTKCVACRIADGEWLPPHPQPATEDDDKA